MSTELRYKVLVEGRGFAFFVEREYENLPDFCVNYNMIGHSLNNCKRKVKDGVKGEAKTHQKQRGEYTIIDCGKEHQQKVSSRKVYV